LRQLTTKPRSFDTVLLLASELPGKAQLGEQVIRNDRLLGNVDRLVTGLVPASWNCGSILTNLGQLDRSIVGSGCLRTTSRSAVTAKLHMKSLANINFYLMDIVHREPQTENRIEIAAPLISNRHLPHRALQTTRPHNIVDHLRIEDACAARNKTSATQPKPRDVWRARDIARAYRV